MERIQRSYEERIRGQARKKWLTQIIQSAWTSGANMTPVFKSMFNSLYKVSCAVTASDYWWLKYISGGRYFERSNC